MLTVCGLLGSLPIVTAMLALSAAPPPVGVKVTAMVQDEFAGAVVPQVPPVTAKSPAFAPLILALSGSEDPDRLVTVTSLVFEVVVRVPYAMVAGVTVAGMVAAVLSAIVYGLSGSGLSASVSVPDSVPRMLAVKVTSSVHELPAASVVVQVPPVIEKSEPLTPLKLSPRVTAWF
jgi:hypothetical protein